MQQFTVDIFDDSVHYAYNEPSCTNHNIIDIDVVLTNYDRGFEIESNSCYLFRLNSARYIEDRHDSTCMEIFMGKPSNMNAYTVQKTLIDMDYEGVPCVTICNTNTFNIKVLNLNFLIRRFIKSENEQNIHTYPLFYIDEEDAESGIPYIIGFSASTKGANGLDVCMSKSYILMPLEILDVPCKFFFYNSTLDYQNLFLMRSKFARKGLFCSFDTELKILRIVNPTENIVDVGNKFFQMVLPSPLCFELRDCLIDSSILFVKHCAPKDFSITFSDKDRKPKF